MRTAAVPVLPQSEVKGEVPLLPFCHQQLIFLPYSPSPFHPFGFCLPSFACLLPSPPSPTKLLLLHSLASRYFSTSCPVWNAVITTQSYQSSHPPLPLALRSSSEPGIVGEVPFKTEVYLVQKHIREHNHSRGVGNRAVCPCWCFTAGGSHLIFPGEQPGPGREEQLVERG